MGYLTQRKKEKRTDITLKLLFVVIAFLFVISFNENGGEFLYRVSALRFHYYIITFLAFLYCLYKRFFSYSLAFFVLGTVCFMGIGYSSRVLFNDSKKSNEELSILYINSVRSFNYDATLERAKDIGADFTAINSVRKKDSREITNIIFSNREVIREGIIKLSNKYSSYFVVANVNGKEIIFVNVDFSEITYAQAKGVFANLTEFMRLQDRPVIIFGDFGITSWSETFVEFLDETNLEVKNRIILTDGRYRFNIFTFPTINVLGYKNMGLEKITFLNKGVNKEHPIMLKISF